MIPLSLPLTEVWGYFPPVCTPGGKSHNTVEIPLQLGPHGIFTSQTCPHWGSSNLTITVQVFLYWHWFLQRFPLICYSKPWLPVFTCLFSPILWAIVCPVSSPLLQIQEALVIFQSVQIFTYLLDGVAPSSLHVELETSLTSFEVYQWSVPAYQLFSLHAKM